MILMAEIPARAVFTATTLWCFKVPASKQGATFCSQTTLSRTACLKEFALAILSRPPERQHTLLQPDSRAPTELPEKWYPASQPVKRVGFERF
ncbi:hypothetical protein U0070_022582 [Myodes glareolus]|uniref:Secreted protein n=1 Tax=Myodes glareolus TaxID=447135 RepID=A0AAW0J029_MYOGA